MNIPPPYCPKYLHVNWATDDYGEVSPSCLPITNKDTAEDIANKSVPYYTIGIALTIWLIILGIILVTYKIKHTPIRRHKKIANAYPYSRFAPHYV
jgi:hypothetical protein